jgi:hypothetical protein
MQLTRTTQAITLALARAAPGAGAATPSAPRQPANRPGCHPAAAGGRLSEHDVQILH